MALHEIDDTDPETARVHLALLRRASAGARLRLALSFSRSTMSLSRTTLARRHPELSAQEVGLKMAAHLYGQSLADEVRANLVARSR